MITVKNLNFAFGNKEKDILKNINMDISRGKVKAILGNNGVGKSTLIKCIVGIYKESRGEIFIEEEAKENLSKGEIAKKIAYISQREMPTHKLVFDMVLMGRKPHINWDIKKEDKEMVMEVLEQLKLTSLAMKYSDQISGGEFQKVLLARALVQTPQFLLLDEPTNNLDLKNQREILELIKKIAVEQNIGVAMVLHDLNLAIRYCDQFLFMKDGRSHTQGGKEIFVAKTIKEIYNIDVEVIEHQGKPIVVST